VVEEVEIVHGHDLGGRRGGHQQRVQALHDIERLARQGLDRGPLEPVPEYIQQADWNPPIDSGRAGYGCPGQTILP
jgi:hypothetical protein